MTLLAEIPATFERPADAPPSAVAVRIRAIRPSRTVALRGLLLSAATAALVPLDWYLSRRAAVAEDGVNDRSEFSRYPDGEEYCGIKIAACAFGVAESTSDIRPGRPPEKRRSTPYPRNEVVPSPPRAVG